MSPAGEIADFAVLLESRASDVSPDGEDVGMESPVDIVRRIPRLWALSGKAS